MTYVIAQPCVDIKDKACIEKFRVDCIYKGTRSLYKEMSTLKVQTQPFTCPPCV